MIRFGYSKKERVLKKILAVIFSRYLRLKIFTFCFFHAEFAVIKRDCVSDVEASFLRKLECGLFSPLKFGLRMFSSAAFDIGGANTKTNKNT